MEEINTMIRMMPPESNNLYHDTDPQGQAASVQR